MFVETMPLGSKLAPAPGFTCFTLRDIGKTLKVFLSETISSCHINLTSDNIGWVISPCGKWSNTWQASCISLPDPITNFNSLLKEVLELNNLNNGKKCQFHFFTLFPPADLTVVAKKEIAEDVCQLCYTFIHRYLLCLWEDYFNVICCMLKKG